MSGTYKTVGGAPGDAGAMTAPFETKIAILLRDDIATWQRVNVTAFLSSGLATGYPGVMGEPYGDADGASYLPMFGQPVMVLEGDLAVLRAAHERCLRRELSVSVFTADLFGTGNDDDNRAAVAAVASADLDLVGIGVHGPRNAVDKVVKGARMHP
jgi:hypothetical protein